jgi:hypothetical protein
MALNIRILKRAFGLVALTALSVQGQEIRGGWAASADVRPMLTVHVNAAAAPGRPSSELFGTSILLGTQSSGDPLVITPTFAASDDVCGRGGQVSVGPGALDAAGLGWLVEGRLVDLQQGIATIDLHWRRAVNRPDIRPQEGFDSEQRLSLKDGDAGVLDLVRSDGAGAARCGVVGLSYEFRLEGPAALEHTAIEYDLWLIQTDTHGQQTTDRYRTTGRQGDKADYFFRPIGFSETAERQDTQPAIKLGVTGALRGRLRADGRIDLTVDGRAALYNSDVSSVVSASGRTLMTVNEGETVEVELPAVKGRLRAAGEVSEVFAGQRTAVRITARRLW